MEAGKYKKVRLVTTLKVQPNQKISTPSINPIVRLFGHAVSYPVTFNQRGPENIIVVSPAQAVEAYASTEQLEAYGDNLIEALNWCTTVVGEAISNAK